MSLFCARKRQFVFTMAVGFEWYPNVGPFVHRLATLLHRIRSMTPGTNNNHPFRVEHVAVLIETETSWGARVIRGIAHFAEKHTRWHLLIDPRDNEGRSG